MSRRVRNAAVAVFTMYTMYTNNGLSGIPANNARNVRVRLIHPPPRSRFARGSLGAGFGWGGGNNKFVSVSAELHSAACV